MPKWQNVQIGIQVLFGLLVNKLYNQSFVGVSIVHIGDARN